MARPGYHSRVARNWNPNADCSRTRQPRATSVATSAGCPRAADAAKHAAMASDKRLKRGTPLGPFDGVPMTAKESFDWKGTPSTWGEPAYKENIATSDAVAITRLTDAGAVLYGKTNVPLMLADWQSFNAVYGTTNNPWDVTRAPGGSSGGSAVALATGMSALEIGSDIGASLRNPAHYCGVYAHKPTYGVVPYRGHLLSNVQPSDISVAGPMARSAKDLTAMLKLLPVIKPAFQLFPVALKEMGLERLIVTKK